MVRDWQNKIDIFRKDPRVPLILTAIFGLLLLLLIWQFISDFKTTHQQITAAKVTPITQPIHLANLHLFGLYSANLQNLPDTQLQFTLEGTVVMIGAPNQSRALIASPHGPTKVYKVGDSLPGNATITRIATDFVVLNDNGALEKLPLPIHLLQVEETTATTTGLSP